MNDPPQAGAASFQEGEAGPSVDGMTIPTVKSYGPLIPLGDWQTIVAGPPMSPGEFRAYCERENILPPDRPLVPTAEETASLPRLTREAFAGRCASRVCRLRVGVGAGSPGLDAVATAALLVSAATVETPLTRQLRCIRRDFDRIKYLAHKHNWADDTPVPPEVFGPMWPKDLIPVWAKNGAVGPKHPAGKA